MTKFEILGHDLTDEEKFSKSVSEFTLKCKSLRIALSVSLHHSVLFSYSQSQQVLKLVEEIEKLEISMLNWKFYGKRDQLELDFS